jgi:GT2 family glycosyltransferase
MRLLHILTLNWNGSNYLEKLIPSLDKAVLEVEDKSDYAVKWYIRDNGSKDNSVEILEKYSRSKQIIEVDHNRASFAMGVNELRAIAAPKSSDLILLLNNDVEFRDCQGIVKMLDLQKKTQADVVGARLQYAETNKLQHAGVIFSTRYNTLPFHFRPGEESDANAKKDRWFQAVTAACCLVREDSLRSIGGMDEGFVWSFEDIDMCLQIKSAGGKIAYCGGTEISHEESASLKKNPVNKMFVGKNVERFRKKWNGKYEVDHEMYLKNSNFREIK